MTHGSLRAIDAVEVVAMGKWTTKAVRERQARIDALWAQVIELRKAERHAEADAVKAQWDRENANV